MPETLYSILGLVSAECTASEVRKAYLRLARETHPDRDGTEEAFKRVHDAYSVLSDEHKRREYDAALASSRPPLKTHSGSYGRPGVSSRSTDRPSAAPRATTHSGLFAHQPARPPAHRAPDSYFPSATHARSRSSLLTSDGSSSSSDTELDSLNDVRSQRRFRRPPSDTSNDDDGGAGRYTEGQKFFLGRSSSGSSSSETVESPTYSFRSARSRPSSPLPPPARWQSSPHIPHSTRYRSPPPPQIRSRVPSRAPSFGEDLDWVERMERAELLEAQAERRSRSRAPTSTPSRVSSPNPHVRGPQPLYRPAYSRQSSSDFVRSAPPPPLFVDQRISSSRTISPGPSPTFSAAPPYPTFEQAGVRVVRKRGAVPGPPPPVSAASARSGSASAAIKSLFTRAPPKPTPRPPPSAYGPPPPTRWGSPPPPPQALKRALDTRGPSSWAGSGRGKHDRR